VSQGETGIPQEITFASGPAAFGPDGKCHLRLKRGDLTQCGGRLVVVQGDPGFARVIRGMNDVSETSAKGDVGKTGAESLFGAGDQVPAPFRSLPQSAGDVVGIAFFTEDKVKGGYSERADFAKQRAGGLGAWKTDDECEWIGWRWLQSP